jgi:hypothetical protein
MSNLLEKSGRFQQDYERYLEKIQKIPEGKFKQEVSHLLSKLVAEIKKLDNMHMEMIYTRQMPSMGSDMKQDILALRKKLDSKLKSLD